MKEYARSIGAIFQMTSAKDNKGVNELFMDLCIMLGEKNVE